MLITIDGLDGAGKSTLIQSLWQRLSRRNIDALITRQPSDMYRADPIFRSFVSGHTPPTTSVLEELALLAAADRRRHVRQVIEPSLAAGKVVLSDRWVYSTYAYFQARGIADMRWLMQINRNVPRPDLAICLDLRPDVALRRVRQRDGDSSKWEEQQFERMSKVRRAFLEQAWGQHNCYEIIDGDRPEREIAEHVWELVTAISKGVAATTYGRKGVKT